MPWANGARPFWRNCATEMSWSSARSHGSALDARVHGDPDHCLGRRHKRLRHQGILEAWRNHPEQDHLMAAGIGCDLFSTRTREALRARKATGNPLGRPKRPGKSKLVIRFVRRSRRCSRTGRPRSLPTRQLRKMSERTWNQEARDIRILWRIRYLCWVRAITRLIAPPPPVPA